LRSDLLEQLQAALGGTYSFERELGHGAMATIYLAHDSAGNPVAFKLLNPDLGSTVGADRFRREIRVAGRLQHPNILNALDSGVTTVAGVSAGTPLELLWFTMPFVRGQNIWERLDKEGPFPADEVARIGGAIASALGYAHEQGVVHRDMKPGNVMLEDQRVLVADFGLARAVSEVNDKLTTTGTMVGTPTYMSPEQAMGDKEIDGRSDIFALACVLYEMLSGAPPFYGPTPQATLTRRFSGPPRKLRPVVQVPEHMEIAILRALARDPAERFATADDFAAALSGRSTPVRAGAPPPQPAESRQPRPAH
jgi:eukaryotic-like serine/threonine-protein kinase